MVEVYYTNQQGNQETRPGYFMRIMDTPLQDIPDQYRPAFGEGKEHPLPPYIELGTLLDRNQVPINSIDIRVEDILGLFSLAIVPLK